MPQSTSLSNEGSDWLLVQAGALRRSEPPEIAEKSDIFIRVGHDVDLWRPKQGGLSRVLYRLWDFLAVTLHQESIRPALSPHPWEHRRAHHCRARPSSPTPAASAPCSRSWRRSTRPPPSARHARLRDPKPFAPRGRAPRKRTCWSSCLSWPHLLRSWSLRSTRSGSRASAISLRLTSTSD